MRGSALKDKLVRGERTIRQGTRLVVYSNHSALMCDVMAAAFGELRRG